MLRALSECSLDADRRLPPVSPSPQRGSVAARPTSAASSKASKASTATGVGLQRQQKQTRDEARRIQVRQMSGAAVGMALKPSRGLRDDIRFAGGEPKDHRSENYRKLRDLQRERQALEQERAKPPPVPFKMKQFENVKARLSTHRPHTASDTGSETASNYNHSSRPSTADSSHRGAPSIASYASTSSSKNYIHLNAIKAKEPKNKGSSDSLIDSKLDMKRGTKMGELPKYLLDRKMEWAEREKERLEALKNECIPKGMKLIPDDERMDTLNFLLDTQQKLLSELSHFALVIESAKLKNKRSMLENKLKEIDEAIGVFSRKKVYVNE